MLPEDSTDLASPANPQAAAQQGESPNQGGSATKGSGSPGGEGPNAGPARGKGSSSGDGGSPGVVDASPARGSSSKNSGSLGGLHASPARVEGSSSSRDCGSPGGAYVSPARVRDSSKGSSRSNSSQGSSSKASSSRDDGSKGTSSTAVKGNVLSYKDKLMAQAAADSSAATDRTSPASTVSSAKPSAGQDPHGRSRGQDSKSKGGISNAVSSVESLPRHSAEPAKTSTSQDGSPQGCSCRHQVLSTLLTRLRTGMC